MLKLSDPKLPVVSITKSNASLWLAAYPAFNFGVGASTAKPGPGTVCKHSATFRTWKAVVLFLSVVGAKQSPATGLVTNPASISQSATLANAFSIFEFLLCRVRSLALFTRVSFDRIVFSQMTPRFGIVAFTQAEGAVKLAAKAGWASMIGNMCCVVFAKYKIFNAIVRTVFVFMMNFFVRLKEAPKMLFHDQSMLENIPLGITLWMMGCFYVNIPAMCFSGFTNIKSLAAHGQIS